MKRLLFAVAVGVGVYLVGGIILLILGTNIFASPLTYQSAVVLVAGIATSVYAYWRIRGCLGFRGI